MILSIIVSVLWVIFGACALVYQAEYFIVTYRFHRPRERKLATMLEILNRDDSIEKHAMTQGDLASVRVTTAKAASFVWVHALLTGFALMALIASISSPSTIYVIIILAGLSSMVVTARLVWLTWFSKNQYYLMRRAAQVQVASLMEDK